MNSMAGLMQSHGSTRGFQTPAPAGHSSLGSVLRQSHTHENNTSVRCRDARLCTRYSRGSPRNGYTGARPSYAGSSKRRTLQGTPCTDTAADHGMIPSWVEPLGNPRIPFGLEPLGSQRGLKLGHQLLLIGHRGVFRDDLAELITVDGFLLNQQIHQAIDDGTVF